MQRNLWTVLAVFVTIFALAWFSNRGKLRELGRNPMYRDGQVAADSVSHAIQPKLVEPAGTAPRPTEEPPQLAPATAAPPSDSISRNPPNGMIFAGTGKFQIYRQGDITLRLNTDTGRACILLATDEQWRMPRVLSAACRFQ